MFSTPNTIATNTTAVCCCSGGTHLCLHRFVLVLRCRSRGLRTFYSTHHCGLLGNSTLGAKHLQPSLALAHSLLGRIIYRRTPIVFASLANSSFGILFRSISILLAELLCGYPRLAGSAFLRSLSLHARRFAASTSQRTTLCQSPWVCAQRRRCYRASGLVCNIGLPASFYLSHRAKQMAFAFSHARIAPLGLLLLHAHCSSSICRTTP